MAEPNPWTVQRFIEHYISSFQQPQLEQEVYYNLQFA